MHELMLKLNGNRGNVANNSDQDQDNKFVIVVADVCVVVAVVTIINIDYSTIQLPIIII